MKWGTVIFFLLVMLDVHAQSRQAEKAILAGNEFYRNNEFGKAVSEYSKVPATDPIRFTATFNRANALYKQDQKVEAVQLFAVLGREAGGKDLKAKSFYNKGVILSQQKNLEESIESYKNALRNDPDDKEARENLQKALLELKKKPPPPKKEEKKENKKQEQQQQKNQRQSKMSPKEAEQRLKLLSQKEKEVQQRMQQAKSRTGGGQPKDW